MTINWTLILVKFANPWLLTRKTAYSISFRIWRCKNWPLVFVTFPPSNELDMRGTKIRIWKKSITLKIVERFSFIHRFLITGSWKKLNSNKTRYYTEQDYYSIYKKSQDWNFYSFDFETSENQKLIPCWSHNKSPNRPQSSIWIQIPYTHKIRRRFDSIIFLVFQIWTCYGYWYTVYHIL